MKIKIKVLAIIYRKKSNGASEFLALRNNPHGLIHGGDYYFVVTGGVENNEDLQTAVRREIFEETGITKIMNIIDLNKICEYVCAGESGYLCKESEFLVQVDDEVVKLNEEHIEYKWLKKGDFINLIAWNDKNDLDIILNRL